MAGDEKELKRWVSSRLHDLLGFSEGAVAQFIVSVARKHTSADSLAAVLRQQGLPAGAETACFAADLLARMPQRTAAAGASAAQLQARQAKQFLAKSAAYALLEEPEVPAAAPAAAPTPAAAPPPASSGRKEAKRERKLRDKASSRAGGEEEEEEGGGVQPALPQHKKQRRAWEEEEDEDESPAAREERLIEAARLQDQVEKEEFEARLRSKDEERTKKLAEDSSKPSKAQQKEDAKRKCVPMCLHGRLHACMGAW